jgi:raffinose synthase
VLQYTGVVGLFNCQGGGWCPQTRRNKSASECSHSLACSASPKDIEWNNGKHPIPTKGVNIFAIYMFKEEKLKLLKSSEKMEISLEPFTYELLTVSPVTTLSTKLVQVAPIGLVKMLNSGGAIQSLEFDGDDENLVRIGVKGSGEMRVFASEKPLSCKIDGVGVEFSYIDQMVVVQVPWPNSSNLSIVEYSF